MKKLTAYLKAIGLLFCLLICGLYLLVPFSVRIQTFRDLRGARSASIRNLRRIQSSIRVYALDHNGKIPSGVEELLEGHYVANGIVSFVPGRRSIADSASPSQVPRVLANLSPYRIDVLRNGNILVYEIPGLWPEGVVHFVEYTRDWTEQKIEQENRTTEKELATWLEDQL